MILEVLLALLLGLTTLLYFYSKRSYNYWLAKGVVQPPPTFFFGHFKDAYLGRENNGLVADKIYKSFPNNDAVGFYELLTPKLLVKSPELIKSVLASDFSSFHDNEFYVNAKAEPTVYRDPFFRRGDTWKPARFGFVPYLTQVRMKEIYPFMLEVGDRMEAYVKENFEKEFEGKELATLFTMDVISSCVFGISSNCFSDPDAEFRKVGETLMNEQLQSFVLNTVFLRLPKIRDLLGMKFLSKGITDFIDNVVHKVVEYRQKNNISRNDLMQQMIKNNAEKGINEIVEEGTVFFMEGFETSAMVASNALYELAMNPDVQECLYDEINEEFGNSGDIDLDKLSNLPYFEKVIKETLRKHVVMYNFQRICTKDTTLNIDGKLVNITKGTPIWVPLYSIHHDAKYYPDPEVFDPERFNTDSISSRPAYTYLPFGDGPRICVGYRLGIMQVKLFIFCLLRKYKILRTARTPATLTLDKRAWLVVPNEQKWVKFEERQKLSN